MNAPSSTGSNVASPYGCTTVLPAPARQPAQHMDQGVYARPPMYPLLSDPRRPARTARAFAIQNAAEGATLLGHGSAGCVPCAGENGAW
ncbi:hypothetical protein SCP_0601220 [Sparassis crispa]|uniref:Uncharacterized protein n=1 Tax=Sparassis crispa TaxID=139825 RepID=A0A401GR08_9APHY|nr:hypothetical protein SCP_0601220 [Sparassis crispa]GBE84144.1 hypothetical protein SCP_0601220 [Sparassis crispa]